MPPRGPRTAQRDARQAASGRSNEQLVADYKDFQLPDYRYVQVGTLKASDRLKDEVNALLARDTPTIHGQRISSLADYAGKKLPFPPMYVISNIMLHHAKKYQRRCKSANKTPLASHMKHYWTTFCSVWNSIMPVKVTKEERTLGKMEALEVAGKRGFSKYNPHKPVINAESVRDLLRGVWTQAFDGRIRERVSVVTYLALSVSTGARPGTFVRPTLGKVSKAFLERPDVDKKWMERRAVARKRMTGAKYGQFRLYVLPPSSPGGPNQLAAFYQASWSKNSLDKGYWYILVPGPTFGTSPCLMLLISLALDGFVTAEQIKMLLDPAFLQGREAVRIRMPRAANNMHVMHTRHGRPCSTPWMTSRLKRLSIALGFKIPLTAYFPRHNATQSMKRSKVSLADIRATLKHEPHSKATAAYETHALPFSGFQAAQGNVAVNTRIGLATDTRANSTAPVALTSEETEEIQKAVDIKMQEWRRLSKSENLPTSAQVARQESYIRNSLVKRKVDDLRDEHFKEGSNAKKARPSETTAAHLRVFEHEDWYEALSCTATGSPKALLELIDKATSSATPDEFDRECDDESVDGDGEEIEATVADSDEHADSETDGDDVESDEDSGSEVGAIMDVEESETEVVHEL